MRVVGKKRKFFPKKSLKFLTKEELDKTVKTIVKLGVDRPLTRRETIESMVTEKDLAESQVRVIEQSDVWKEHAKTHKGAKLTVLEPQHQRDPQNLRESLGVEDIDYVQKQDIPENVVSYGPSEPIHNTSGGSSGGYLAATRDPKNKQFWMGCPCGMTLKAEEEDKNFSGHSNTIKVTSYDVDGDSSIGNYTDTSSGSVYGATQTAEYK
jgi:hypothetical protein